MVTGHESVQSCRGQVADSWHSYKLSVAGHARRKPHTLDILPATAWQQGVTPSMVLVLGNASRRYSQNGTPTELPSRAAPRVLLPRLHVWVTAM